MYTVSLCNVSFSCKINLIKPHVKKGERVGQSGAIMALKYGDYISS
jgi:hypothetical protein